MEATIDYRKSVDTIDEGLMALNLLRAKQPFPLELQHELIDILHFLMRAEKPEYESLLFDKRVTISKESLKLIHNEIKDLKFPINNVETAIYLLQKTSKEITVEEIDQLETYLLDFSHPLWVTAISKGEHGK